MDNVNITASNSIDNVVIEITPNVTIVEVTNNNGGGGGSAALTFTFTGSEVTDGSIDLTGQTGMPVAGSFPSALRVYYDDIDISQSASFTPSTQILFAGFTGEETEITIKITF